MDRDHTEPWPSLMTENSAENQLDIALALPMVVAACC
jgi:hypothetical protein